jgi:hypothetical protein
LAIEKRPGLECLSSLWISATGAGGVAALDHEISDDAVELDAVVETDVGEVEKVSGGDRNLGGKQGAFDCAAGGVQNDTDVFHPSMYRQEREVRGIIA